MTTSVPKLAGGWIIGLYLPAFALLLWGAWNRLPPLAALLVTVFVFLLSLGIVRAFSTVLTPDGLTQMTLRGRVQFRWSDIQHVDLGPRGSVALKTADGVTLRISPIFFHDFDDTLNWLAEHLRHVWPPEVT